ncbi:MAG: hypothetical protein D6725_07505 [Planctomycetota bacterium]|nr:MAG: hypothetical protein D6725_07505 [Planctomycetota bacterium]
MVVHGTPSAHSVFAARTVEYRVPSPTGREPFAVLGPRGRLLRDRSGGLPEAAHSDRHRRPAVRRARTGRPAVRWDRSQPPCGRGFAVCFSTCFPHRSNVFRTMIARSSPNGKPAV